MNTNSQHDFSRRCMDHCGIWGGAHSVFVSCAPRLVVILRCCIPSHQRIIDLAVIILYENDLLRLSTIKRFGVSLSSPAPVVSFMAVTTTPSDSGRDYAVSLSTEPVSDATMSRSICKASLHKATMLRSSAEIDSEPPGVTFACAIAARRAMMADNVLEFIEL